MRSQTMQDVYTCVLSKNKCGNMLNSINLTQVRISLLLVEELNLQRHRPAATAAAPAGVGIFFVFSAHRPGRLL